MTESHEQPKQQLAGYELIQRIGSGGYGEVWSASAPGGLQKAIKYVYGTDLDKRAQHEFKALEKIKQVRHPFLLSLERIEIVENRLLVVTELADGSLRDRLRECYQKGLPGIPREELLGYLEDAADALDYLATRHDLAHLDVKPENLLLVAGHVKVGDFGLVKHIGNMSQCSLVGGMTPTYAAPEVFRGSPGRQSDQYSLAILYQELLTGALPFNGANAAELTSQHLNQDPDLRSLPEADRFAIARALSKDPAHRYESASEFVRQLRSAVNWTGGAQDASSPVATQAVRSGTDFTSEWASSPTDEDSTESATPHRADRCNATEVFDEPGVPADARGGEIVFAVPTFEGGEAVDTPIPEYDPRSFYAQPTFVIGIGGTAGRVLRGLRASMTQHFGVAEPLRAFPLLLLDTDPAALGWATRGGEAGAGLCASDTVALPLRRPHAYRDRADSLLRWLGRRWLYNIPRSLTTEGIRPLGRLALVDHARRTFQRIRTVLQDAASEQAVIETEAATGQRFAHNKLRVYVVASISGGAGSGMSIDVAYAVRSLLEKLNIDDATVTGLMLHSTYRESTRCDLARVNAYSWLSEFERFRTSSAGFPGDSSCGLPAHKPGVAPFDHTYLVPLGERLDTAGYDIATRSVADYLFADVFTPAQRALDAWRAAPGTDAHALRSIAVTRRQARGREELSPLESDAARAVVRRWVGESIETNSAADAAAATTQTDQIVHGAVAFIGESQLEATTLAANCRCLIEAAIGGDARAYAQSLLDAGVNTASGLLQAMLTIDPATGRPSEIDGRPLGELVQPLRAKLATGISRWVLSRIDEPGEGLSGASRAAGWCRDYLRALAREVERVTVSIGAELQRRQDEAAKKSPEQVILLRMFELALDLVALEAAASVSRSLVGHVSEVDHELESIGKLLGRIESRLAEATIEAEADATPSASTELVEALRERLEADHLKPNGGLLATLATNQSVQELTSAITHAVRSVVSDFGSADEAAQTMGELQFAEAPLAEFGGRFCRLAVAPPAESLSPSCVEVLKNVTHVVSGQRESVLITELVGMSLPHVAADLISARRDYAAFAERVRTRRDISWIGVNETRAEGSVTNATNTSTWDSVPMDTAILR
ncbi:tubulin-like doman-containing protein [Botrimarina hoheduenensis]|uniref:Tubulin-like protein n=1 Tax=Botrimarina hoheduenensis TaxID=2528000 RepID=A0A5C5VU14_9BACT|nr:tubulin-like doman-containing protein [Botrimarina hoheduenensis]TWT41633.1 Tubulin-like protein [Botrimarina hoheduenensis]